MPHKKGMRIKATPSRMATSRIPAMSLNQPDTQGYSGPQAAGMSEIGSGRPFTATDTPQYAG